jgi:HSP20 family molecular chaperone IbpA
MQAMETVAHLHESESEFVIELPLPEAEPETLDVVAYDHTVIVRCGRETDPEGFGKAVTPGSGFRRELQFPPGADMERLRALLLADVLELHAPKSRRRGVRRIEVHRPFVLHGEACAD